MYQLNSKNVKIPAYSSFTSQSRDIKADKVTESAKISTDRVNFKGLPPIQTSPKVTDLFMKASHMPESFIRFLLLLGGLALAPIVDYETNKDIDKDTRNYSATRIAVRQIVGGFNGVTARYIVEKLIKAAYGEFGTLNKNNVLEKGRLDKLLEDGYKYLKAKEIKLPLLEVPPKYIIKENPKLRLNYINSTCQIFAIATGIASIFILDAPITTKVVNYVLARLFPERYKKSQPNKSSQAKGGNK